VDQGVTGLHALQPIRRKLIWSCVQHSWAGLGDRSRGMSLTDLATVHRSRRATVSRVAKEAREAASPKGYGIWPALALAAFIMNFFTGTPHIAAAGIALAHMVGPRCGAGFRRLPEPGSIVIDPSGSANCTSVNVEFSTAVDMMSGHTCKTSSGRATSS
jgi:hypothetical protein